MRIWVDADACPKPVKEILFKASIRTKTHLILVANHYVPYPNSYLISAILVEAGFDKADTYLVEQVSPGELVITGDIILASYILEKKAYALSPRGEIFSPENIKTRLNFRDIHEQMRSMGENSVKFSSYGIKEKTAFANALDKYLAKKAL